MDKSVTRLSFDDSEVHVSIGITESIRGKYNDASRVKIRMIQKACEIYTRA